MASEKIREDAYRAAAQLVVDATADADTKLRQARFSVEARAVRDAAYATAADAYAEAEQRHRDRLAAIQRHFGQQVMSRGDPNADHALAFVDTVADPRGRLLHSRKSRRSVGLSRSITTVSNARFVSTPADASRPTPSPSPGMGGRVAARSLATPKPSWRPREPALG